MGSYHHSKHNGASELEQSKDKEEQQACMYALQLASASVPVMVLKAAIEMDVLEIMARAGPGAELSAAYIAAQIPNVTNTNASVMLDRMLRLLASYKILTCSDRTLDDGTVERVYGLELVCKFLVKDEDGVSMAPLLLMNQDNVLLESWFHLKDAVITGGIPFNLAYGMSAFEYPAKDERFNTMFNKGMSDHTTIFMKKILETYKGFEGINSIVDVGGGVGVSLDMILTKYPSMKGINFDLPHVIKHAPRYETAVEHVGGDMFVSIPKGSDAVLMKWILHDWSDEFCTKVLKNIHEALPEHGKLIIVECIIPPTCEPTLEAVGVYHVDNMMMAHNPGGKERTEREFNALAKATGFSGVKLICSAYHTWIMECYKN
ncbi:hypothetical protein MKW94_000887 [Papaver nudicaule]|uniref:Uncharacterized protein n=1 Tax=Papaver nudicaule TaxID=74823 RepID=A0AA41RV14_PAPNU|nr:hypothetical protein [Papaver nudicaule]